uniref:SAM domain-containing protein n=1 Tax=Aegilops tauschii TaxID=37682 RepID=R7W650_AEGTA
MASTAKVTITLGRSGQIKNGVVVVKRRTISDIGNDDEVPVSGRKRPVRERLGNNVTDSDFYGNQQSNKRRQTESSSSQLGDDVRQIGSDDLRLKLMRKGLTQKSNSEAEQNGVDLREKLSRKSKKLQGYEARRGDPESRSSYDEGEIPESGSGYGSRGRVPESRASTLVYVPRQASKCSKRHDSPKKCSKSHVSPQGCSERHVSPEKFSKSYRLIAEFLFTLPIVIDVRIFRHPVMLTNSESCADYISEFLKEVPSTVTGLLNSMGLEKYVVLFQAEEVQNVFVCSFKYTLESMRVDMAALSQMKDSDLKDMGVPMVVFFVQLLAFFT